MRRFSYSYNKLLRLLRRISQLDVQRVDIRLAIFDFRLHLPIVQCLYLIYNMASGYLHPTVASRLQSVYCKTTLFLAVVLRFWPMQFCFLLLQSVIVSQLDKFVGENWKKKKNSAIDNVYKQNMAKLRRKLKKNWPNLKLNIYIFDHYILCCLVAFLLITVSELIMY